MAGSGNSFTRVDIALAVLAVLGYFIFFRVYPTQHPDAAARPGLGEDQAAETAQAFLTAHGYKTDDLSRSVSFRREANLLDSLQHDLGRPQTVSTLKQEAGMPLPAYYWSVTWSREGSSENDFRSQVFSVSLTTEGEVWNFDARNEGHPGADRGALAVLLETRSAQEQALSLPNVLTDSLLAAALQFTRTDSLWRGRPGPQAQASYESPLSSLLQERPQRRQDEAVYLTPRDAIRLARYHLSRSGLAGLDLQADSTWLITRPGDQVTAQVRFRSSQPVLGQSVQTEVEVDAAGALHSLHTEFNGSIPEIRRGPPPNRQFNLETAADLLAAFVFAVLVLWFLVLFLRRLNARLVDVGAALRDALLGGLAVSALVLFLAGPELVASSPNPWLGFMVAGVGVVITGAGGAFLIFLVAAAMDSIMRETWPQKLHTLSHVRRLAFRNIPVGLALVRGVALAGAALGVLTVFLWLAPGAVIHMDADRPQFLYYTTLSPVGYLLGQTVWYSLFISFLVLAGLGALLYRWKRSVLLVLTALVLASLLVRVNPVELQQASLEWAVSGLIGLALALAFWRYDVVTCFVAILFIHLLPATAWGWMASGSPEQLDAAVALGLGAGFVLLGFTGVFSRRSGAELPDYVPSYVEEMAVQERMKRELELAHQVQASLLPRSMPQVEGLEIAAMCLAAQEVGGDYYDFVEIAPGRLAVVVGDVSGKGIQAAFYMTLAKGFLQTLIRTEDSPAIVLRRVNALFYENAPRGTFVSLIYGIVDVSARTFTFARAGHNPLILKRSPNQEADLVQPPGMAVGLTSGSRFDETIEERTLSLRSGDVLVLYTDGFSEAMNASREQYGDLRLARKVGNLGHRTAEEILHGVSEEVHHFVEAVGRHDDMTMVVVKLRAPAAKPHAGQMLRRAAVPKAESGA